MSGLEELHEWAVEIQGARKMLQMMMDSYRICSKEIKGNDGDVYTNAELDMILSSKENTYHFLCGDLRIHYRNHQRNKKGKLIKVEAYWAP